MIDRAILELFETLDVSRGIPAVLGDGAGNVVHPRIPMGVWVRMIDPGSGNVRLAVAFNVAVTNKYGLPVFIRPTRKRGRRPYEVIGEARFELYPTRERIFGVPPHAPEHLWPSGSDITSLDPRQIVGLRAHEQDTPDMTLQVDSGWYERAGVREFTSGDSPAFTAPSANWRWDVLVINTSDVLAILQGTVGTMEGATIPEVPAGTVPIVAVFLHSSTTTLTERNLRDLRHLPRASDPARAGMAEGWWHVHAYKEDKSNECNGSKTTFYTANEFEPGTLVPVLNGLDQREGALHDYTVGAFYDSFIMNAAPLATDALLVHYIAATQE